MELLVLDDPVAATVERLAAGGHIALAGGATPQAAYELAATRPIDWTRCTLWFGDERCVPPDDELSNYGMAQGRAARQAGRAAPVHRIAGELGPHEAADAYEAELRDGIERFDLVLLGLGPDAHCASLFPHDAALDEQERRAVGVEKAGMEPHVPRVTLTLPVINAARSVVFLVAGADKAEAVARAFGGEPDPGAPASLVDRGGLTVLLDAAAATELPAEFAAMRIACGFDHAGFPLKDVLLGALRDAGHEVLDLGTDSTEPVDYPDVAVSVGNAVREGRAERGVLVCGSGAGVAVAASKLKGIRAATVSETYTAHQAVEHDDVNVLCLGARVLGPELAVEILRAYAAATFTGEERHVRRLEKVRAIEREET